MKENEDRKTMTATAWLLGLMGGVAIFGLLAIAYLIGFNQGKGEVTTPAPAAERPAGEQTTAAADGPGEALFVDGCGSCHTLAEAGTTGTSGPDLDQLQPDQARVLAAIANGGTGSGAMPEGLYTGKQAQEVAEYVSSVAGQ